MSDFGLQSGIILYMERHSAYAELLRRHRAMVWRMCWLRARGDWEQCRDLVQEVSVALWMHLGELRTGITSAEERAWVRCVTRSALDHKTRKRRVETLPLTPMHEESIADEDRQSQKEDIDDMMASLSHDEQRIMQLRLEGFRANEIASIMGLSNDAVYQRIHRIAVKLRRLMAVLLVLAFTTTLAIAVVPQWRSAVFGGAVHQEEMHEPKYEEPATRRVAPLNEEAPDRAHEVEPEVLPLLEEERIHDADVLTILSGINDRSDTIQPVLSSLPPEPTIWVSGNRLIITGVYDEPVKVYQKSGVLVSSQVCHGFCVIDLFPRSDMDYRILVGRRPAVTISL